MLQFVFEPELYPIVETSWEGLECFNLSPCIYAFKATDIAVTGKGTIDGSGSNETWWSWCGSPRFGWKEGMIAQKIEARPRLLKCGEDGIPMYNEQGQRSPERVFGPKDGLRPQLVNFNWCERILLEDVTLLRSPFWVIHPLHSTDITVRRVKIINNGPNGDGCDPADCEEIPRRTFIRMKETIASLFDINIKYSRLNDKYYIDNEGVVRNKSTRDFLLSAFAVNRLVSENSDLSDRILLEETPSASNRFLPEITAAMRENHRIVITYQSFEMLSPREFEIEPFALRYFG